MNVHASHRSPARWTGTSVERQEDNALLRGLARFADDLPEPAGTLHMAYVRSPHAHADIVSVDATVALAVPGVAAVVAGAEIRRQTDPFLVAVKARIDSWSLAVDTVRHVGEAVAVVLADDRARAEDGAERVDVRYAPRPAVIDPLAAIAPDAPVLHAGVGSNVPHERRFSYGDVKGAFAAAAHVTEITIRYPRNCGSPMEGCVVLAQYDPAEDAYDVLSNFQGPFSVHPVMAKALRVPASRLRLRTPPNSGGSFGSKLASFSAIVLACAAARLTGRPVKWVEDRLEHLAALAAGPNRVITAQAAVTRDGEVTALRFDQVDDYGANLRAPMPGPLYRMHGIMSGAYKLQNLEIRNRIALTNKMPASLVRGFGGPQIYFALERLMQRIAVELGLDPLDVIRRNLVPSGSFPYRAPAGALLDSGDYPAAVARAIGEGRLDELRTRRAAARAQGRLYGIGFAAVVEPAQSNMGYLSTLLTAEERERQGPKSGAVSTATVSVDPLGGVFVTTDSTPQGQGHRTVLAQIVADELGLAPADITVNAEMDTQRDVWSIAAGCYSCRFSSGTVVAAQKAARDVRGRVARIAAPQLDADPDDLAFADGRIFDPIHPDRAVPFRRVAGTPHWSGNSLPQGVQAATSATVQWSPPQLEAPDAGDRANSSLTYGFVFDFCGVEIDRDTGAVRIDRYVTLHDAGVLLNPAIADGQVRGAFAQGLGAALYEELVYGEDGAFLSGTFADYLLPTAAEVPEPQILHFCSPSLFNPLGAKGIGEGNCMSTPVCIANAVADATGVADVSLPLVPAKVAEWIWPVESAPPPQHRSDTSTERIGPVPGARGPALSGSGEVVVAAPSAIVWRNLLDPVVLAAVVPGCRSLTPTGPHAYTAEASLGAGPVRGVFRAEVALSGLVENERCRLDGALSGALGSAHGTGTIVLCPDGEGTRISYTYGIDVAGKIASVGSRLLDGATRALVREFFVNFAGRLAGEAPRPPWWRRLLGCVVGRRAAP